MLRNLTVTMALAILTLTGAFAPAAAADFWISPDDPAVITNNDCGLISDVAGKPVIRRPFQEQNHPGIVLNVADRISSGDELMVPEGSRLELTTGSNVVVALGSGTHVRVDGLRSFPAGSGRTASRLDIAVLTGDVRVQVRLNEERPEALFAALAGADLLVRRGDVEMVVDSNWRGAVLAGEASARMRRGGVIGTPYAIEEGRVAGTAGREQLTETEREAVLSRLPFSFELVRIALPPLPPMGGTLEAP